MQEENPREFHEVKLTTEEKETKARNSDTEGGSQALTAIVKKAIRNFRKLSKDPGPNPEDISKN